MPDKKLNSYDKAVIENTDKLANSDLGKNVMNTISSVTKNPIGKAGIDLLGFAGNTLGLLQSGVAKGIAAAFGKNNSKKGLWGYTPTEMYKDISGKETLTPTEATFWLGMDIFADPVNLVTGGLHKITKAKNGLSTLENIVKAGDKAQDFSKLSITDISKVADTEIDKLNSLVKTADKTQKKGLKIDIDNIENSKIFLDKAQKKGFNNIDEIVVHANKNVGNKIKPKYWASENYKKNISPENFIEKAKGGKFNAGAYNKDYQLGEQTRSIKEKKTELQKLLTADFQKIEVPNELEEIFDTTFKRGKDTLSPKTLEYASIKANKPPEEVAELYDSFNKTKNKIKYVEDIEPESLESLKGLLDIFEQDSVLDLKRTREGLKRVASIEKKEDFNTLFKLAKDSKMSYADLNKNIIKYIETGETSNLSKATIEYVEKTIKPLYKRTYQLKRIIDKQIGYNDSYNPRRLKKSDFDLSKLNTSESVLEFNFSFEKNPKMRLLDSKNPTGKREARSLTTEELQAFNELNKKNRVGLIEDIPTLMQMMKNETIEMYASKIARGSIKNYEIPAHLKNKAKDYTDITVHGVNTKDIRKNKTTQEMVAELSKYGAKPKEIKDILSKSYSLKKEALNKYIKDTYPEVGKKMGNRKFDTKIQSGIEQNTIQVPKNISEVYKEFYKMHDTTPNAFGKFIKASNTLWKGTTLAFSLRYYFNNIIDNGMILFFDNPKALSNMPHAFNIGQGKAITFKNNKGERLSITPSQLAKAGILEADYGTKNLKAITELIGKDGKNALQSAVNKGFNMANFIDDHYRTALAIEELKTGKTLKQSAKTVQKAFYDPQAVTERVKIARTYAMPFIGFTVDNLPKAAKRLIRNPQKVKAIKHITEYSKREDENQGYIDPLTANSRMVKFGDFYLDLEPKMSMLQPITLSENVLQALFDPKDNTIKDLAMIPYSWLSPFKSVGEVILNINPRTGRSIYKNKDSLFEISKKSMEHLFKAYASVPNSIRRVVENEDYGMTGEDGNLDTLWNFFDVSDPNRINNIMKKAPSLLFGTQYYSNFEKVARDVSKDLKDDITSVNKKMSAEFKKITPTTSDKDKKHIKNNIDSYKEQLKELYKESSEVQKSIYNIKVARAKLFLPEDVEVPNDSKILDQLVEAANTVGSKIDSRIKEYTDPTARNMKGAKEVQPLEIYDGDTIKVQMDDGNVEIVRIAGIDSTDLGDKQPTHGVFSNLTEEQNNKLHKEAKDYTVNFLVENKDNIVVEIGDDDIRDNYDRLILTVKTKDGRDLSEELLERGLAEPFYRGKRKRLDFDKYKKAYSSARKNKQGVFSYISLNEEY